MIDIRKLKELVRLMVDNDLSEIDLQDQQETVTVKRGSQVVMGQPVVHHAPLAHAAAAPAAGSAAPSARPATKGDDAGLGDTTGLIQVKSPMVGTVYLAPNPESPTFVKVGANVGADSTVCMIEAMKVFSEIKAETSGTIERVLVKNAQAVEYGQALFLVRPN